tara:strand:+ start:7852 stop:8262 length:411 start_codon:yes stop_codon:yes gene_type:complete
MGLTIRPLIDEDYDTILVEWWKDWSWKSPRKDFLPENGSGGLMVMDNDIPVCAGFMYTTNSAVAWVDWIISNKNYRKKPERAIALTILVDSLTNSAKEKGFKYVYALIKHKGLIRVYEELGYTQGDSYPTELIKKI